MLDDAGAGKDVCDSCGASGPKFRCSSCQGVRYCSRECQAYAWKKGGHKQQCKEIQVMTHEQTQRKNILELVSAKKDILRMPIEELRSELAWYKDELQFERAFYEQVFGVDPSITSKEDDATALVGMLKEARSYYATNMILQDAAGTSTFWSPKAPKGRRADESPKTITYLTHKQLLAILVRLPRSDHANLAKVCKRWNKTVHNPDFWRARKACPLTGHSCLEQTVLLIGGCHASNYAPHVEGSMLDDRGYWVKIAPLIGRPVFNSTKAVFCRGEVYVVGGEHAGGTPGTSDWSGNPCSCFMIWNPRTNQWRGGAPWPNARVHPTVVECNGRIYVMGGQTRSMMGSEDPSCDRYDPATRSWAQIKPLPKGGSARSASNSQKLQYCHMMGGCSIGSQIYLFGGQFDDCFCTNRVLRYDTKSDTWSTCRPMPGDRFFPECHAIGKDVYVLGGLAGSDKAVGTTWKYSTADDEWTVLDDAPLTHSNPMVLLGKGTNARIASVPGPSGLTYYPASDTWKVGGLPPCPQGHLQGSGDCVATF